MFGVRIGFLRLDMRSFWGIDTSVEQKYIAPEKKLNLEIVQLDIS